MENNLHEQAHAYIFLVYLFIKVSNVSVHNKNSSKIQYQQRHFAKVGILDTKNITTYKKVR